jgi:hypothetical protein
MTVVPQGMGKEPWIAHMHLYKKRDIETIAWKKHGSPEVVVSLISTSIIVTGIEYVDSLRTLEARWERRNLLNHFLSRGLIAH